MTICQKILAVLGMLTIIAIATHTERKQRERIPSIMATEGSMPELRM